LSEESAHGAWREDPSGRLHRTIIDDVPVHWVESAPLYTGALMFRSGRADETVPIGGVNHLIEHLALHQFGGRQPFEYNGFVDGLRTVIHATGRPDEIGRFFARVCAAFRDPPLARLPLEARVLRTEASGRSFGPVENLLWLRFGATGHGLQNVKEFGLETPDPDAVASWIEQWFTSDNAVAWFSGPPPADLRLELGKGRRIACPVPTPVSDVHYPAHIAGSPGAVSISFLAPREDWFGLPLDMAARRLEGRLRYEQGLTYSTHLWYGPLTEDTRHSALWTGCLPEHSQAVLDDLLDIVEDLSASGPSEDELAGAVAEFVRSQEEPFSPIANVSAAADNDLLQRQHRFAGELLDELESKTRTGVASVVAAGARTALVVTSPNAKMSKSTYSIYPSWSSETVDGTQWRSIGAKYPWSKTDVLVTGAMGVSVRRMDGNFITVRYDQLAAVVVNLDGSILVIGDDGFYLHLATGDWSGGAFAVATILKAVPAERIVHIAPVG
jgi:zinc protease